jgi:hypothetical protein
MEPTFRHRRPEIKMPWFTPEGNPKNRAEGEKRNDRSGEREVRSQKPET